MAVQVTDEGWPGLLKPSVVGRFRGVAAADCDHKSRVTGGGKSGCETQGPGLGEYDPGEREALYGPDLTCLRAALRTALRRGVPVPLQSSLLTGGAAVEAAEGDGVGAATTRRLPLGCGWK